MVVDILRYVLCFMAGALLNMSLAHLANFAETTRHRSIARTPSPKLTSILWGILQLFLGSGILLLLKYQFALSSDTLCLFAGFSLWAIFLGALADKKDKEGKR